MALKNKKILAPKEKVEMTPLSLHAGARQLPDRSHAGHCVINIAINNRAEGIHHLHSRNLAEKLHHYFHCLIGLISIITLTPSKNKAAIKGYILTSDLNITIFLHISTTEA